jgi:hypothetical protein
MILTNTVETFVDIGDPHGDHVNEKVINSLFAFMDDFKPSIVIHGGDNWNLCPLRKGASKEDQETDMQDDWDAGKDFLSRYLSYGKKRYFLRGNHDERLWDVLKNGKGESLALARRLVAEADKIVERREAQMFPYDSRLGILDLEGIRTLHGYAHGVGAARKLASIYGTCIFHHTHSMEVGIVEKWPKPAIATGTGCLCHIDQDYNSRNVGKLRHENGFTYGYRTSDGFVTFQARFTNGQLYASTEIRAY